MSRPDGLPLHEDMFDYSRYQTPTFMGDAGFEHVAMATFRHRDPDFALDPLSTNCRFQPLYPELAVLGTVVFAGTITGSIQILIPDCTIPPVDNDVINDLRYVVELSLGAPFDMGKELPPPYLVAALCPNSLDPNLGLRRQDYWEEIDLLLAEWRSVNNLRCPECYRVIKVNMLHHLRLVHMRFVCYWRCPVPACPSWFSSELNGKDHIDNTHRFREGRGYSFYECLRRFGLEWFGSCSFFDQRKVTGQSLWMDLALARRSGQD